MTLADAFDAFLLDLDGVVWRGDEPIDGVADVVAELRARGKRTLFVTNNSSRVPRDVAAKLISHKIPTPIDDIVTSAHAVVLELRRLGIEPGDRIHVCGAEGLARVLGAERFAPTDETDDVTAVVLGWNPHATFADVRRAADLVRAGVPFVASNADATYPSADGLLPGAGSLLAAVEVAAGRRATVVGKPRADLFRIALVRTGATREGTLYLGDRAETDVVGAHAAGLRCALVLTGVTEEGDLARSPELPDDILDRLDDLLHLDPAPPLERRKGALLAKRDHKEVAAVEFRTREGSLRVERLRVGGTVDDRARWPLVRHLLVGAVRGADAVEAPENLEGYLRRIGAPLPGTGQPDGEEPAAPEPEPEPAPVAAEPTQPPPTDDPTEPQQRLFRS